jgi:hypothetical protein
MCSGVSGPSTFWITKSWSTCSSNAGLPDPEGLKVLKIHLFLGLWRFDPYIIHTSSIYHPVKREEKNG